MGYVYVLFVYTRCLLLTLAGISGGVFVEYLVRGLGRAVFLPSWTKKG